VLRLWKNGSLEREGEGKKTRRRIRGGKRVIQKKGDRAGRIGGEEWSV